MLNDFDDTRIEANVFRRAAARENQRVILFRLDLIKCGVQREIVAALLRIGLIPFEIMDGGANELTGLFARANSVNGVADHQQRLERDHHLVVFNVITNEHKDGFLRHRGLRNSKRVTEIMMPAERPRLHEWRSGSPDVPLIRDELQLNCRGLRLAEDEESARRRREELETGRGAQTDTSRPQNRNCPSGDWRGRAQSWRGLIFGK